MEHSLLTPPAQLGRENLVETYLGLARAVPNVTISYQDNCINVLGPKQFSFCNFVADFKPHHDHPTRLKWITNLAKSTPGFWVFCMDGDEPQGIDRDLEQHGFTLRQNLVQMVWEGKANPTAQLPEAKNPQERLELSQFVSDIFFNNTPDQGKTAIAQATAASHHRLYSQQNAQQDTIGVLMLSETQSALGLYNLAVSPQYRRLGVGSNLVHFAKQRSQILKKPLIIQCGGHLRGWYARLGFQVFGSVRAYSQQTTPWRDMI